MKRISLTVAPMAAALAALAGCGGNPPPVGGAADLQVVGQLPSPGDADLYGARSPYNVAPYDTLTIDVFGVPDLRERAVIVDAGGRISYPLIGTLDVLGKTPGEIAAMIEGQLRGQFIRNPQVTVNVKEAFARTVTVTGQVRDPGIFPVVGDMTLIDSVAKAKGLTEYAKDNDVVVFRTVGGQKMATLYNLKAIQRGMYPDPQIYPNDRIVVGESNARRIFDQVIAAATLVTTPVTVLLNK